MPVHPEEHRAGIADYPSPRTVGRWWGLLSAPVLVLFGQWGAYMLVPDACARQSSVFVHLVHLCVVLLIAAAFLLCHREWDRLGRGEPDERPGPEHRARFMAFTGMIGNGFFALVAIVMWLATILFSPCSA